MSDTYLKIKYKNAEELVPTKTTFNKFSNIYTENGIVINNNEVMSFNLSPTSYGNVVGTCDNALMLDNLTPNEIYSIDNKPTKVDVGLDQVNNQYNYGHVVGNGTNYLQLGNCRLITQRFLLTGENAVATAIGNGIYVCETTVNWPYYWSFKEIPIIIAAPIGISYRIIQVKVGNYSNTAITKVQFYSNTNDMSTINTYIACTIIGEV